jgi:hypothetical protein
VALLLVERVRQINSPMSIFSYIDATLDRMFLACTDQGIRHELACAGLTNLLAYLGWLPGALEYSLLAATISDPILAADVILAYTTLTSLSPGQRAVCLAQFAPSQAGFLFSTTLTPAWTSRHFCERFAIPLLEVQRLSGQPTLQTFSTKAGQRIQDRVYYLFGLVWFGLVWFGLVWFGLVWFGLVWFGLVWFGVLGQPFRLGQGEETMITILYDM